ncbi:MAG: hypothetical protein GTN59_03375 [Candidatus Dadabacteria bacterium]|nr:hypothetical protein [Candidatus Dadabacteria bacterium]
MATPSLNNGLFLRDNEYVATSHIDSYHLMNLMKDSKPDDLGPIDMWAQLQKVEMPLYQMSSFNGKNVIDVEHPRGEFTWRTPVSEEMPYITENIEANPQPGIDGTTFKIKLNKRCFGHGDIITYDKYNGAELYITSDDILDMGDGVIYTVQLVNNDSVAFMNPDFLACNTEYFRVSSARGEYGERFSDMTTSASSREFYNYVGNAEAHVHYSVSSRAKLMELGGMTIDGKVPVTEIWRSFDDNMDPSINSLEGMIEAKGADYVKRAVESGDLVKTFLTKMEAAHLSKIAYDIETYLMWGKGGRIKQDGPDDLRLSVGLWKQLDNAFKHVYNKVDFRLDMFRAELLNFFRGKVEFEGPDSQRQLIVQTGIAGMKMINDAVLAEAVASGLVLNAYELGAIERKGMDLGFGFAFTSYHIPFLANVKFVLNPAFDNVHQNKIENPIIDGYPLSSYSFIIFDVTDTGSDNIKLLRKKWDSELKWWYQNGTMDYMGRTQGFQSSGQFNGYRVYMTQALPAIWVEDPTKVLKIVMRNPITGFSL